MNLNHLLYFRTLAQYEHYHKASEVLHITQPSLSNAIHHLEEDLGVALFEKRGRGVRLTEQGARYLEYVNSAFHDLDLGAQSLTYEQIEGDAALNLGVVLSVVQDHLPVWIRKFQERTGKRIFYSCRNGTFNSSKRDITTILSCSHIGFHVCDSREVKSIRGYVGCCAFVINGN